jgi:hypothetical protein
MVPSERLKTVLGAGDVFALFPILKDWTTDELKALLKDLEDYTDASYVAIDTAWEKTAMTPGVFLSETLSKTLDKLRDEKRTEVMMAASEICSVAIFYLQERGVKTEMEND